MNEEIVVEALVIIGNVKPVIKMCEPSVAEPMELKKWMVIRTLKALELFEDEWERVSENTRGEIQQTDISNEGSIRGDT